MNRIILLCCFTALVSCNKRICSEETLISTFNKKNLALIDENTEELKKIALNELNFLHSNGWHEDKNSFLLKSGAKQLKYKSISVDSFRAIIVNRTGILTGLGNFDITYKGSNFNVNLYFTETYVCMSNSWKLLARHSSKKP